MFCLSRFQKPIPSNEVEDGIIADDIVYTQKRLNEILDTLKGNLNGRRKRQFNGMWVIFYITVEALGSQLPFN